MEQKIGCEIMSKTWEGLSTILDEQWPQKSYENSHISNMEKLNNSLGDMAVILNSVGKHIEKNLERDLKLLFPDTNILLEEVLVEGNTEFVNTQTEAILG